MNYYDSETHSYRESLIDIDRFNAIHSNLSDAELYNLFKETVERIDRLNKQVEPCFEMCLPDSKKMLELEHHQKEIDDAKKFLHEYIDVILENKDYKIVLEHRNTLETYNRRSKHIFDDELIRIDNHLKEISEFDKWKAKKLKTKELANGDVSQELNNEKARSVLGKLNQAGILDECFKPVNKLKGWEKGELVDLIAAELCIQNKWKVFEQFWNLDAESLRSGFNKAKDSSKKDDFDKKIMAILK